MKVTLVGIGCGAAAALTAQALDALRQAELDRKSVV